MPTEEEVMKIIAALNNGCTPDELKGKYPKVDRDAIYIVTVLSNKRVEIILKALQTYFRRNNRLINHLLSMYQNKQ
jgi:hypothetical protein